MKYAFSDRRTLMNLPGNDSQSKWILAAFFFSDRGDQSQKTVEGLLQRILYELIKKADCVLEAVRSIFRSRTDGAEAWPSNLLREALLQIVKQRQRPMNICLFIDALDEHSEDYDKMHWRLLELMKDLTEAADGKIVKLRLCLSSRPEPYLQDMLQRYPGFSMQEHTQKDISTYVHGRMRKYLECREDLISKSAVTTALYQVCDEVVRRAQGVFLWVKLVATDLTQGLVDGNSPEQISEILSSIPGDGDLHALFNGILSKIPRVHLAEAFVMLQIFYAAAEP